MIELFESQKVDNNRKSSKGNQLKWRDDKIWYKADYTGYEGLAEYVISHLLKKTNLQDEEYVLYDLEQIKYKTNTYNGVASEHFLQNNWQLITLERLFKQRYNLSLTEQVWRITSVKERLQFLTEQMKTLTKLEGWGQYITKLLTLDAFFLNEDRHFHNIAVLMNDSGEFQYCPIFDNGAALLSDTKMDYPLEIDHIELMKQVEGKTVCQNLDEALDEAEALYGTQTIFVFQKKDVEELLESVTNYSKEEVSRVKNIIYSQMNKYSYMFAE